MLQLLSILVVPTITGFSAALALIVWVRQRIKFISLKELLLITLLSLIPILGVMGIVQVVFDQIVNGLNLSQLTSASRFQQIAVNLGSIIWVYVIFISTLLAAEVMGLTVRSKKDL